jgi:predicted phage terminase large subunit-like protein
MAALKDVQIPLPATVTAEADPRQAGEALAPDRFPREKLLKFKSRAPAEFLSLYQNRPVAEGGDIFLTGWWEGERARYVYSDIALRHNTVARYIFLDTAIKDKDANDYSAYLVAELTAANRLVIREVRQRRLISALLPKWTEDLATAWNFDGKLRQVVVEDKGSGTTTIQTLSLRAPQWLASILVSFMPNGTKEYRAKLAAIWCEPGMVLLPFPDEEADWLFDFADPTFGQLFQFPHAAHDDMVDAFTMAVLYLEYYLQAGLTAQLAKGESEGKAA